jgi:NDP-sugar pyrophosphorylase family protein
LNEKRQEYLLPDMLLEVARREPVHVVEQDFWVSVDKPDDMLEAEKLLKERGK